MKSNLNYWQFDTEAEGIAMQELCHQEHYNDIFPTNPAYFEKTTRLSHIWKPNGEIFWVMRAVSGIIKKSSLITKMNAKNSNITIVKSKKTWKIEPEGDD